MFSIGNNKAEGAQPRELQRLKRQDLLELLLEQMREADGLSADVAERDMRIRELEGLAERLKDRLDLKDEQIAHLKEKLDLKDEQMAHLRAKLDDKDALIAKLKGRLDLKDQMIAAQVAQGRDVPADLSAMEELLEAEEFALEALMAQRAAEEAEAEAEAGAETEAEASEEPEAEEAEPEPDATDATEADDEDEAADDGTDPDYERGAHAATGEVASDE